jgi:hypothetical protein
MLNARKCRWGMDTWGEVSFKGTGFQAAKDVWRALLGSDAHCEGKRLITINIKLTIGSIMQVGRWNAIIT